MSKPASHRDLPPPPTPSSPSSVTSKTASPGAPSPKAQSPRPADLSLDRGASGRYSILALRRDGVTYPGDILADTIEYRGLRAKSMQSALEAPKANRLAKLEEQLRQAPPEESLETSTADAAALRAFQRYNCRYLAALRYADVQDPRCVLCMPVWVADISAGGVKIAGAHAFEPGLPVVLHIRDTGPDCIETQLPSRIAWTAGDAFGLMFAGPPRLIEASQDEELAA